MDLRQRDPFERKFAELVIRFRSIGLLLVLLLIGINSVKYSEKFNSYLGEMGVHLRTIMEFIQYHGLDSEVILAHWNLHQFTLVIMVITVCFTPLIFKHWKHVLPVFVISASIKSLLFLNSSCTGNSWLLWVLPLVAFVLSIVLKASQLRWANYFFVWLLGLCLAFVQLSQLSLQLGVDNFVLFPQWLIALIIVSGTLLAQFIFQMNSESSQLTLLTPASVVVAWYGRYFKPYLIIWGSLILLSLLAFIPALKWNWQITLYFTMGIFQTAVLHLVLFPMVVNVLGLFPKKS